jgi:hypothetical protein
MFPPFMSQDIAHRQSFREVSPGWVGRPCPCPWASSSALFRGWRIKVLDRILDFLARPGLAHRRLHAA